MRGERLQIMLSPEELDAIDTFRFEHRLPSRAAAVRELLQRGLQSADKMVDGDGRKSSEFGVFSRGPGSHREGEGGQEQG
jgi:metal-responsive CopG/Arc/MetJ family transcriptional regulator